MNSVGERRVGSLPEELGSAGLRFAARAPLAKSDGGQCTPLLCEHALATTAVVLQEAPIGFLWLPPAKLVASQAQHLELGFHVASRNGG
jgi:hypothetical protein